MSFDFNENELSEDEKIKSLVEFGIAEDEDEAREMLEDMGLLNDD
jgi:hypothetical protein